jgi:hypothetical protein
MIRIFLQSKIATTICSRNHSGNRHTLARCNARGPEGLTSLVDHPRTGLGKYEEEKEDQFLCSAGFLNIYGSRGRASHDHTHALNLFRHHK